MLTESALCTEAQSAPWWSLRYGHGTQAQVHGGRSPGDGQRQTQQLMAPGSSPGGLSTAVNLPDELTQRTPWRLSRWSECDSWKLRTTGSFHNPALKAGVCFHPDTAHGSQRPTPFPPHDTGDTVFPCRYKHTSCNWIQHGGLGLPATLRYREGKGREGLVISERSQNYCRDFIK